MHPPRDYQHERARLDAVAQPDRRLWLRAALATAASSLSACGGGAGGGGGVGIDPTPGACVAGSATALLPPPSQQASAWHPSIPEFEAGSNTSFDLAATLPANTPTGGTFGIASGSTCLPAGMVLSTSGVLSVGTATAGMVSGVIFTYVTP